MSAIRLTSEPHGDPEDAAAIEDQINQYNVRVTGRSEYYPIRVYLRDESGALRGGITAHVWGDWLDIAFLWVADDLRGQGYGGQLLTTAEDEARGWGCRNAHVSTYSFQARPFYERHGYRVISTLEDYPPGHAHYHLRKAL